MADNTVITKGKYIEIRFIGDQSEEKVRSVAEQAMTAAQEFINNDEWVRVLVDLSDQGNTTNESRRASKEAYNYGAYDKIAIIGFNKFLKNFINTVIATSGRQSSVKLFDTKEKALEWLLKDPSELKI